MSELLGASRLLIWCDRRRVFTILGARRHCLFNRRPLAKLIKPALDVGKFVEVDIAVLQGCGPRIANHVGDSVLTRRQIALLMQAEIHHSADAMDFVIETYQPVDL